MEQLIIKNEKFKEKLVQVINESEIPAFIVKSTLKDLIEQVALLEQQQLVQAKNNLKKEEKKERKNGKN